MPCEHACAASEHERQMVADAVDERAVLEEGDGSLGGLRREDRRRASRTELAWGAQEERGLRTTRATVPGQSTVVVPRLPLESFPAAISLQRPVRRNVHISPEVGLEPGDQPSSAK